VKEELWDISLLFLVVIHYSITKALYSHILVFGFLTYFEISLRKFENMFSCTYRLGLGESEMRLNNVLLPNDQKLVH